MKTLVAVSAVLAIAAAVIIAVFVPGDPALKVRLSVGYSGLALIFLFGLVIIIGIASGQIDISNILSEHGGGASMSRFQLLIFTLVIAFSFFLIVVGTGHFPESVPPEVLTLLGISATTYGVSKGIQASSPDLASKQQTPPPPLTPPRIG